LEFSLFDGILVKIGADKLAMMRRRLLEFLLGKACLNVAENGC
jgi:hypothetical protein